MSALHEPGPGELTWWESARSAAATPAVLVVEHPSGGRRIRGWLAAGAPHNPRLPRVAAPLWKVESVGAVELARGLLKMRDFVAIVLDGALHDLANVVATLRAEPRAKALPLLIVGGGEPIARAQRVHDDADALRRAVADALGGNSDTSGVVELEALLRETDVPIVGVDAQGIILHANLAAARIVGVAGVEALIDRAADDVISAELVASRRSVGAGAGRLASVLTLGDRHEQKAREARLFHAQRLVAMGELTSGICHDFNNLLTTIIGNLTEVVHHAGLATETREAIEDALAAAVDGANLTRRLGAKPSNGRPRAVDLGETLGEFGRIMRRVIRKEVKLDLLLDEDVSAVVDRTQLESAVMNLVLNAQNAIVHSGTLRLVVRRVGDDAQVLVADDGRGMDAETVARATEAFFTTRGDAGGTGLGLAMVDDFVRRFRGTLTLESALGQGTVVTMSFPWVPESSPRTSMPTR